MSWIAENPNQHKEDWIGWNAFDGKFLNNCPCCEYVKHAIQENEFISEGCKSLCPLIELWGEPNRDHPCIDNKESPGYGFVYGNTDTRQKQAKIIADFSRRKYEELNSCNTVGDKIA
jgi:hypothetical protein